MGIYEWRLRISLAAAQQDQRWFSDKVNAAWRLVRFVRPRVRNAVRSALQKN